MKFGRITAEALFDRHILGGFVGYGLVEKLLDLLELAFEVLDFFGWELATVSDVVIHAMGASLTVDRALQPDKDRRMETSFSCVGMRSAGIGSRSCRSSFRVARHAVMRLSRRARMTSLFWALPCSIDFSTLSNRCSMPEISFSAKNAASFKWSSNRCVLGQ